MVTVVASCRDPCEVADVSVEFALAAASSQRKPALRATATDAALAGSVRMTASRTP
jgi:hypothetical protein